MKQGQIETDQIPGTDSGPSCPVVRIQTRVDMRRTLKTKALNAFYKYVRSVFGRRVVCPDRNRNPIVL